MKLYYTPTSPFVRKVLIAAHEVDLADRIETTLLRPSPMTPSPELSQQNPLSKIPALILDDGRALYDSAVICEYLSSIGARPLFPERGDARWRALRVARARWSIVAVAIAAALVDAVVRLLCTYGETLRLLEIAAFAAIGVLRDHLVPLHCRQLVELARKLVDRVVDHDRYRAVAVLLGLELLKLAFDSIERTAVRAAHAVHEGVGV